jgi:raffinose/stachyose/melibiose transport system substrate-binding protein
MKVKKILAVLCASTLLLGGVACGGSSDNKGGSSEAKEISVLMGKPEVSAQFEEMLKAYATETGVKVTMIPLAGQDAYEKMTSLYASGNAPNILMVGQEFDEFKDKFMDLTDTKFVKNAAEGTLDFVTVDDKVYGTPTTVEAYGIIYNPDTIKEALGDGIDPSTIRTQDELVKLYKDLEAAGVAAFTLSPMDWSLGAHLSNSVYAAQSDKHDERHQFFEELKEGKVSLKDDPVFNGWVDLLDIFSSTISTKMLLLVQLTKITRWKLLRVKLQPGSWVIGLIPIS